MVVAPTDDMEVHLDATEEQQIDTLEVQLVITEVRTDTMEVGSAITAQAVAIEETSVVRAPVQHAQQ